MLLMYNTKLHIKSFESMLINCNQQTQKQFSIPILTYKKEGKLKHFHVFFHL